MRVRGFLAFIEMLDRSSALNRAWENASVDYTKRFKRNRAGKRGRTDTFHFSCPPRHSLVTAIGINRCRSLCVCVCVCAIITGCHHHGLVHITQMPLLLLLLDGDTLRVWHCCCSWIDAIGCNQFLRLLFHHTFDLADATGRPYDNLATAARVKCLFLNLSNIFGEFTVCAGTLL